MSRGSQLWLAVLAGPVIWFFSVLANFALATTSCITGWKAVLFVVVAIALIVTVCAGLLAWKLWRRAGAELPGESGGAVAYERTLSLAGVLLSAGFFVVIVAQCVPNLFFGACR